MKMAKRWVMEVGRGRLSSVEGRKTSGVWRWLLWQKLPASNALVNGFDRRRKQGTRIKNWEISVLIDTSGCKQGT